MEEERSSKRRLRTKEHANEISAQHMGGSLSLLFACIPAVGRRCLYLPHTLAGTTGHGHWDSEQRKVTMHAKERTAQVYLKLTNAVQFLGFVHHSAFDTNPRWCGETVWLQPAVQSGTNDQRTTG